MRTRDIRIERGRSAEIQLEITDAGAVVDLRLPDTKLWFTAKRSKADTFAEAVLSKTYVAGGASSGISVLGADPGNVAFVQIDAADTLQFTTETSLAWDCLLETPDGGRTTVAEGGLKVALSVSDPPLV